MTKSIIGLFLLTALPVSTEAADPPILEKYQAMTSVEPRCSAPRASNEIVVCGRRRADRWRVPYLLKETGDPSIENVSAERNGLIATTTPCQDNSVFLIGCGKVGLSVNSAIGGGSGIKLRPLAD